MRIKVVIMSHDTPKTTKALYDLLHGTMDVTVFNVGSSEGMSPLCPADLYPNLYYTGCWREAMRRFGDYDVLWLIGGDVTAENTADEYKNAIETVMPFGTWSPVIVGRSREVMSKGKANGRILNVFHLEGIATAISQDMMKIIDWDIPDGSKLGWGIDIWMSWLGWTTMSRNILDGRVSLHHPFGCGYNRFNARKEVNVFLYSAVGPDWESQLRIAPEFERFNNNIRQVLGGERCQVFQ